MVPTVEQLVRDFEIASAKVLRKYNTPAKARKYLMESGIITKFRKPAAGARRAKQPR